MYPVCSAIWIFLLLLPAIPGGKMESPWNQAVTAQRPVSSSPAQANNNLYVDISVDYGAQLMLTDSEGRKTGYDRVTGETLDGIPDSSYNDDSISDATDDSPDGATAESRVLEIHPKTASKYALKVSATDRNSYNIQFFCGTGKGRGSNISASSVAIAPGEEHSFTLAVAPGCSGWLVSGAFRQQNASGTPLLSYASPVADHVHLSGGRPFRLVIVYDRRISSSSFAATVNGSTIVNLFHPSPNTLEAVTIPVKPGHNLIQVSVSGTSERGSPMNHTDSFVVEAN